VHVSHEALTLHSPVAHPAREVRLFKAAWCGCEGEIGADFSFYGTAKKFAYWSLPAFSRFGQRSSTV
jgi:hypothetical protein